MIYNLFEFEAWQPQFYLIPGKTIKNNTDALIYKEKDGSTGPCLFKYGFS